MSPCCWCSVKHLLSAVTVFITTSYLTERCLLQRTWWFDSVTSSPHTHCTAAVLIWWPPGVFIPNAVHTVYVIWNAVKSFTKTLLWINSMHDWSPKRLGELLLSGSQHQDLQDSHTSLHHSSIPDHIPPPRLLCVLNVARQARQPALHSDSG